MQPNVTYQILFEYKKTQNPEVEYMFPVLSY